MYPAQGRSLTHHPAQSVQTLQLSDSLLASTVQFAYCYDHPLQCSATRYFPKFRTQDQSAAPKPSTSVTLLLVSGISLQSETWIPVIEELYRLTNIGTDSHIRIRSVWVVERPNHGDPGIWNTKVLKEWYPVLFRSLEYAEAIRVFMDSDIMSKEEKQNLVAVGHSGGGGSIMQALELGKYPPHSLPIRSLICLEVPYLGYSSFPYWQRLYNIVSRSNTRRPRNWKSREDAFAWMKTHFPWNSFHPDVLKVVEKTYFKEDEDYEGRITMKTTLEQETACYLNDRTHLSALPYLRTLMGVLKTHWVFGSKGDIWLPEMYKMQNKSLEEDRGMLASLQTIQGAGHYFPVVKPKETAAMIVDILNDRPGAKSSLQHSKL